MLLVLFSLNVCYQPCLHLNTKFLCELFLYIYCVLNAFFTFGALFLEEFQKENLVQKGTILYQDDIAETGLVCKVMFAEWDILAAMIVDD